VIPATGPALPFLAVMLPAAFCGGFVRGFTGFGGPLLVLPVMTIFEPAASAAATVLCMDVFANVQMLPATRSHWSARVLVPLLVGTAIGLPLGTYVLVTFDPSVMRRVIAAVVLAAAGVLLLGWRYTRAIRTPGYGTCGFLGGAIMGATGLGVVTPLLLSAGPGGAAETRANIVAWVFLATLFMLALLFARRVLVSADLPSLLPLIVSYLVGIAVGCRMHNRASEAAARRATLICVIAIALVSIVA